MLFSKKPNLTREDSLAARPLRNSAARIEPAAGGARVTIPLTSPRWGRWLFRYPAGATKTFELDSVGSFVWDCCDGRTTVKQIIRRLANEYNLNLREAEVSTLAFLKMLASKGLIGLAMDAKDASRIG